MRKFVLHTFAAAVMAVLLVPAVASATPGRPPAGPVTYSVTATDSLTTNAIDLLITSDSAQAEIKSLDAKIAIVATQTAEQSATLDAAVRTYETAQQLYNDRAVEMYQGGDYDMLSILLDARSFSDLVARLELVTRVLEADRYALEELEIVADEARFQAARLDALAVQLSALQTARGQRALTASTSQTTLTTLELQLTFEGDAQLDIVRSAASAFRQKWVEASIPLTATVKARSVSVSPYTEKYVSSKFHYSRYRSTSIPFSATASWASDRFNGAVTASGQTFNTADFTCAHPTLPLGTWLAITRTDPATGKVFRVIAVVNDRGPYGGGSTLQLSRGAAEVLGLVESGSATVACEIVKPQL